MNGPSIASRYRADGFHIHDRPVLSADLVARAVAGMDAVTRGESDTGEPALSGPWDPEEFPDRLCKMEMPHFGSQAIREVVSHSGIGELAAAVTGASMVQVWWVQLLRKPPSPAETDASVQVGWHQDRYYWQVWEEGSELFTAWVALSDVEADCGPMMFLRGSNRWGFLDGKSDFFGQDLDAQRESIELPPGETWEEVSALMPAGGVSFHDRLTYHGSRANHSDRPRRSFAIHMRTEKSKPVSDVREGLTAYLDDPVRNPVVYGKAEGV